MASAKPHGRSRMLGFTTLKNHPERHPLLAYGALQRTMPLGRAVTDLERLTFAVASCRPTHHLIITSKLNHRMFGRAFAALRKRIERRRGRPLVYVGVAASGLGRSLVTAFLAERQRGR